VVAVAGCELRLQWRSPALWIVAVIFALAAATGELLLGELAQTNLPAVTVANRAVFFAVALLPLLFMRVFARDRVRRFAPLLWSRPLAPAEYALGKGLACAALGVVPSLAGLVVGYLLLALLAGGPPPLGPWLALLPVVTIAALLATSFGLLCIALAPQPALGAVIGAGLLLYLAFVIPQTLLRITNLGAVTLYYAPGIGYGPDTPLMLAQYQTHLLLALLALALLALVLQLRQHLAASRPAHWAGVGLATLLLSTLTVASLAQFQSVAAEVSHYRLAVTLDPGSGAFAGAATFTLTPSSAALHTIYFALNPGLRIQHISLAGSGAALAFTSSLGWTRIDMGDTVFPLGGAIALRVGYAGSLAFDRDDYTQASPGLGTTSWSGYEPLAILDYGGQGVAFLQGPGDWYPMPWTLSASALQGSHQAFDEVSVRLPAAFHVFCALATPALSADGRWQTLDMRPAGPLPMAFLAALAAPGRLELGGAPLYYPGPPPVAETARFDATLIGQVQQIDRWLGNPPHRWTAVALPLIAHAVIGPGLLLLPEARGTSFAYYASAPRVAGFRFLAGEAAQAWWLNAMQFAPMHTEQFVPMQPTYTNEQPTLQSPQGRIALPAAYAGFADPVLTYYPELLNLVADYTAALITDQAYGHGFLDQEMSARAAAYQALLLDMAHPSRGPSDDPFLGPRSAYRRLV
jgi:ABC-type transport system involved in multi-copper enzyme maturation permease subunit